MIIMINDIFPTDLEIGTPGTSKICTSCITSKIGKKLCGVWEKGSVLLITKTSANFCRS